MYTSFRKRGGDILNKVIKIILIMLLILLLNIVLLVKTIQVVEFEQIIINNNI